MEEPRENWKTQPRCCRVHVTTVAHGCHGKTKNLTAKLKTSRQNQKPHGKTKCLKAKPNTFTAKGKNSTAKPNRAFSLFFLKDRARLPERRSHFRRSTVWFCRDTHGPPYVMTFDTKPDTLYTCESFIYKTKNFHTLTETTKTVIRKLTIYKSNMYVLDNQ